MQEAFLRAYQAFPRFRCTDGKAWFLTIVRHVCFSLLRKRRRHDAEEPFDEELHPPDASHDTEAEARELKALRSGLLRRALETLPPEFREMIVLRDLEGLGYKEVASVTGLPLGTVMSRLSRARDRLRDAALALSRKENLA